MKSFIKNKICFILASLLLIVATSCKDDDNADGAQISFSRSIYILEVWMLNFGLPLRQRMTWLYLWV